MRKTGLYLLSRRIPIYYNYSGSRQPDILIMKKIFIIGLGGSVVMPGKINFVFLKKFKELILRQIRLNRKFVLVIGGGKLARDYQISAKKIMNLQDESLDWLGIYSTRLNAHFVKTIFEKYTENFIIDSEEKSLKFRKPVIIASGWRPGWSTDYVAIRIAKKIGADFAIMSGKPAYVYNKDNQKYKDAKPLKKISWDDYQKLIPKKWSPGLSSPVDPMAAKYAKKWGIKAHVVKGNRLKNLENLLNGKKFSGTTIL